jgi:hypothetical protein
VKRQHTESPGSETQTRTRPQPIEDALVALVFDPETVPEVLLESTDGAPAMPDAQLLLDPQFGREYARLLSEHYTRVEGGTGGQRGPWDDPEFRQGYRRIVEEYYRRQQTRAN